jgi:hypothetical protein
MFLTRSNPGFETRLKLGTHHSLTRNTEQAERLLKAAITDCQSLSDQAPANALLQVARTGWTLADLQRRQNRPEEAVEQLQAALKNLESFINQNGRAGISNGLLVGLYRRVATFYEESGKPDLPTEARTKADAFRKAS